MLPPRHVYTANVRNATSDAVALTVVYELPLAKGTATVELSVEPNATAALEQKLVEEGTCTYTAHIVSISATRGEETVKVEGPYNVNSPTKDHPFTVELSGEKLAIREGN